MRFSEAGRTAVINRQHSVAAVLKPLVVYAEAPEIAPPGPAVDLYNEIDFIAVELRDCYLDSAHVHGFFETEEIAHQLKLRFK